MPMCLGLQKFSQQISVASQTADLLIVCSLVNLCKKPRQIFPVYIALVPQPNALPISVRLTFVVVPQVPD